MVGYYYVFSTIYVRNLPEGKSVNLGTKVHRWGKKVPLRRGLEAKTSGNHMILLAVPEKAKSAPSMVGALPK